MLRKICCIFAVICIFVSSFAISSSAAGSTFESDLFPVNSFVDLLGYQHDFFFIYGDQNGVVIEFRYKSGVNNLSLHLTNSDLEYTFVSSSGTASFEVYYRDLKNGSILADLYENVNGEFVSSYNTFFGSVSSDSELRSYPFSNFRYYSLSQDCIFSFYTSSLTFFQGAILWAEQDDGYLLSSLSEPVFDGINYWIVFQDSTSGVLMQIYFDLAVAGNEYPGARFDVSLQVTNNGRYRIAVFNPFEEPSSLVMYYSLYDLSNGWYSGSSSRFFSQYGWSYANISTSVYNKPKVKCYGLGFENDYGYSVSLPTILWNYDELVAQSITAQTLLLYSQILQINHGIDDLEDYLRLINIDIGSIHDLLEDIRDSLLDEGESFTQPPTDALEDYLADESKVYDVLPTGMQQNIDTAFGSADVVFSGNGAFALIRGLMQGLVFDVPKLSGFVFFALAVGIAVLILGRKVNNG